MVAFFNLKKKGKDFIAYSPFVRYFLFLSLIFLIAQKENIKIAYSDLISGRAYKYDFELKKRYQLIRRSQVDTVYISKIENKPKTIFEEDITNNNAHWKNGCYNAYFQKIIILKENENE